MEDGGSLPGEPRTWRELRAALKRLIARTELTAVAVEKLSADPEVRRRGAESIADSTISRKLSDREAAVDARSLRTIVTVCRVAAERNGHDPADADVDRWLRARTRLAEREPKPVAEQPVAEQEVRSPEGDPATAPQSNPEGETSGGTARKPRGRRLAALATLGVLLAGGIAAWAAGRTSAPSPSAPSPSAPSPSASAPQSPSPGGCAKAADRPVTAGLTIGTPAAGTVLRGDSTEARGTVTLLEGEHPPWLMLFAQGECRYYLEQPVLVKGIDWSSVVYVDPAQRGGYAVFVVVVDAADDATLHRLAAAGGSPSIARLPPSARFVNVAVRCCA